MVIQLHPHTPEKRKISQIAELLKSGGIIIYPTDSVYGFACLAKSKKAIERLKKIKAMGKNELFTIMAKDIGSLAELTPQIDNSIFKVLKKNVPGPFTFIFNASKNLPKLIHSRRNTIGIRIPSFQLILDILDEVDDYLIGASVVNVEDDINPFYFEEEDLIRRFEKLVDAIVLSTSPPFVPSGVVDTTQNEIEIIRKGPKELLY